MEDFHWTQALSSDMSYTGAFSSPTRPAKTHVPKLRFTQLNPPPSDTLLPGTSSCAFCIYSTAFLFTASLLLLDLVSVCGLPSLLHLNNAAPVLECMCCRHLFHFSHSGQSLPSQWEFPCDLTADSTAFCLSDEVCIHLLEMMTMMAFSICAVTNPTLGQYVVSFVSSISPASRHKPSDQC